MADPTFLHISFNFQGKEPNDRLINAVKGALDWYRYSPNCWVIWTRRTPGEWNTILRKYIEADMYYFVCELYIENRQGWMPRGFWDWLKEERD